MPSQFYSSASRKHTSRDNFPFHIISRRRRTRWRRSLANSARPRRSFNVNSSSKRTRNTNSSINIIITSSSTIISSRSYDRRCTRVRRSSAAARWRSIRPPACWPSRLAVSSILTSTTLISIILTSSGTCPPCRRLCYYRPRIPRRSLITWRIAVPSPPPLLPLPRHRRHPATGRRRAPAAAEAAANSTGRSICRARQAAASAPACQRPRSISAAPPLQTVLTNCRLSSRDLDGAWK